METAETTYGHRAALDGNILPPDRHAEYVLMVRRAAALKFRRAGDEPPEPEVEPVSDEVAGAPVYVYANHGRWVVDCPGIGCGGAQVASRDDHRFFCVTCGNSFIGGRWLAVIWPDDADAIEAALRVRPVPYQNWTHDETVDALLADNADPVNGL